MMVVEIRSNKVRLGVDAPKEMPVHRGEIHQRIQEAIAAESGGKADAE